MPYSETRTCEDCSHEWDHVYITESVTVGPIDLRDDTPYTLYTCPKCDLKLRVQRLTDGNSWRHWCRTTPPVPTGTSGELLSRVEERVTEILAAERTIYRPVVIDLGEVERVRCKVPLVAGPLDRPTPACPKCSSPRSVYNGVCGFASLRPTDSTQISVFGDRNQQRDGGIT
jgi:hypothetical protein